LTQESQHPDGRAWLAAVLRGELPPWPAEAEAFAEGLWPVAEREGVIPLLHQRLREARPAPPSAWWGRLAARARGEAASDMLREEALRQALDALAAAAIPVLVMKGSALAYSHYPSPSLRPRCDSDLLLPDRHQAGRAWEVLRALGYRRAAGVSGELAATQFSCALPVAGGKGGFALDIHWQLNNQQRFARAFRFDELAAAAIPVAPLGPHARALAPPHALLLAALHRIGHAHEGSADRLIWLYDIHLLAAGLDSAQWDELATLAAARGLAKVLLDGLRRSAELFATPLPEESIARMGAAAATEDISLEAFRGRFRREWDNWQTLSNWGERGRFLREHLFPPAEYLLQRHGVRSRLWLPWLYWRRAWVGLWKRLR
jgi:hypothetical protein